MTGGKMSAHIKTAYRSGRTTGNRAGNRNAINRDADIVGLLIRVQRGRCNGYQGNRDTMNQVNVGRKVLIRYRLITVRTSNLSKFALPICGENAIITALVSYRRHHATGASSHAKHCFGLGGIEIQAHS